MYKDKENKSLKMSNLPQFTDGNLEDYMEIIYNHQKQCQKTGKYLEADMAKKKLAEVKVQLQKNRKTQMIQKQEQQKAEVQNAHLEQMEEFNKYWDEKMLQYQKEAEKVEQQALQRHQVQMEQYLQQVQKSLSIRSKESSQIINLKKVEQNLAKQQNYIEAHKVQKQIQQLQKVEYEKWNQTRNSKIRNLLNQLKNKQENQISALRQRIQQGFQQQKKVRIQEQDKLVQKYLNFLKELQNHHHQDIIKLQKQAKLQSTMNFSRQSQNNSRISQRN